MPEIKFETGLVKYKLNDTCEITFNPTDSFFVERLFNVFNKLDEKQESYKAEIERTADKKEIFAVTRKCDAEMRAMIDDVLCAPVCDALFGCMNVYALANGLPVWANLMLAIMDEIDTSFAREQKLTNSRISKYTAKYHR